MVLLSGTLLRPCVWFGLFELLQECSAVVRGRPLVTVLGELGFVATVTDGLVCLVSPGSRPLVTVLGELGFVASVTDGLVCLVSPRPRSVRLAAVST